MIAVAKFKERKLETETYDHPSEGLKASWAALLDTLHAQSQREDRGDDWIQDQIVRLGDL